MFISIFFLVLMFNEVQSHIDICLYGVICLYCIYSFNGYQETSVQKIGNSSVDGK